jgi:signal transduction histidine kinase/CheY-like chemotaxis protein
MKRANITAGILLSFLLLMTIFSFLNINQRFISFLNSSLEQQTTICGSYMESQLESFENDLNKLLFDYQFSDIFKDDIDQIESKKNLQLFYSKYRDLITNVFIFDNHKNYYGLYINEGDKIVEDIFPLQRQQPLSPRDKVEQRNGFYIYHYPYFEDDQVSGNIIVEIDFDRFAETVFSFYPEGKTITWKWVVNADSKILSQGFPKGTSVEYIEEIADSIDMYSYGLLSHAFYDSIGNKTKVNSAYYPLSVFNQNLGIVFTASQDDFNHFFIHQNLSVSSLAFVITLLLIIYLLLVIGRRTRDQKKLMMSEIINRQILEGIPVGLMILDSHNIIRNINGAAQVMMFVGADENLVGKDFSKQFLISNKYLLKDNVDSLDTTDYLYYEKDGIDTVIFRIEKTTRIGGEELKLVALIDVSPIERSRKQEVAANRSKSDFLASMSHEIRTPMNGILGMVTSLLDSDLNEKEVEKLAIIKKSSALLMTIINDILDYSKIEAGKMLLEEIPFRLREEISLVMELFKSLAEEKGLVIESDIAAIVPDKLIGDPFRFRQVISNLVSNAIKFTEKGKILISVSETENVKGKLQLLFCVEDTGIGIPEEKISSIFASYSQSRGSVSRKFGGTGLGTTISKQLVELMNGEIWVESPSRISSSSEFPGSKFSFTIEVYSNEKIEKTYNFDTLQSLNHITVLFLTKEPNPERNSINKILNKFGVNVVTKIYQESNIDTVLHHLKVKNDLYQLLIISDKSNLDGFALANRLKDEHLLNKLPAILISNNDQPGNYKISKKLGIDYYVIEPFESKEIFDILNDIFPALKDHGGIKTTLNTLPAQMSILLVEDNIINQKVAQSIFKNIGYEITLVSNGAEAIKMTSENEYDIIFMDLYMPEVDGFEATIQIRKNGIKTPIIAMSADIDDQRKADAVFAGMDEYLSKPAKIETVKQLLIRMFSTSVK